MSGYPLLLHGERVIALVVGGGVVAHRKVEGLLACGATVRVVAPRIGAALRAAATRTAPPRLTLIERAYESADIANATIIVAASDSRAVNRRVATDGRARVRLVNVADAPTDGNCATVAAHRSGPLVVGVSAGGVPRAAARVRDAVAARFDGRYAGALADLRELRARLLAVGDAGAWRDAERTLIGPDFCAAVESGVFSERMAEWA